MGWFDRTFNYLFPFSLVESTPWADIWLEKEKMDFLSAARIFFPVVGFLWLGHYWFFDRPMGLQPQDHWLQFRLSMTSIALTVFIYYMSPLVRFRFYRLPAALAGLVFCYYQARVTVWYPEAPWVYCFAFVMFSALILRTSVVKSSGYALVVMAFQWPVLMEAGVPVPVALSAGGVTILSLIIIRASYLAEIKYFLLSQQNIDTQRRNIELNIEFTDRVKSFIPGEIANRLERHLQDRNTSVIEAIYEVLRPRKQNIACLFSDIRGFTEGSKDLDAFIRDSVLPNVKESTNAIEIYGGIPRKIGDLIFAYFDHKSTHLNLIRSILAGLEIARINEDQNADLSNPNIERYILISTGEAIVGNIGGFDSSVEITALGSPVNYLSRVDELTKHPKLRELLVSSDLIICNTSLKLLHEIDVVPNVTSIDLSELGLSIRNFHEQTIIHTMRPTTENRQLFSDLYKRIGKSTGQKWNEDSSFAA